MSSAEDRENKLSSTISQKENLQSDIKKLKNALSEKQKSCLQLEKKYNALKLLVKRKDNMALRLENLSGVGLYVPEIIHKLKNPLMGISGYSELAELAETKEEMLAQIAKIQPQVQKLSNLLGQIRSMISHESGDSIAFEMNNNLTESLQILEIFKPKIFNLEVHFSDQQLSVYGDPFQINQIHLCVAKIFFKTIKHDQNRLIKITTTHSLINQLEKKGLKKFLQTQTSSYWDKIKKISSDFVIVSYQSNVIDIAEKELSYILSDLHEPGNIDKQVQLSFEIIKDIARRHRGNFLSTSDDDYTAFYLMLPKVK